ncbi:MAG: DUF342 domain-containing protein, partial [Chitinivibrionales bacterium]|nr:DUF342 domain-containing protein [Chitinivibrionales bacterium]MBD3395149.1 DUF342 domain-containing protein [Chitinivibrionales bacterium]
MRDTYPTVGDLRDCLRTRGICHGIKHDVLEFMAAGRICKERVCVAEGDAPQPGEPGKLEYLFDTSSRGRPQESSDGRVDLRNLQLVINVEKGQELVRRLPPAAGTPGRSVYGEGIDPSPEPEAQFKMGAGIRVSDDDPNVLVAEIDGAVVMSPDEYVEVIKSEIIASDIDYNTGNVSFTGDLTIRGSVRAGFEVNAKGNLRIGGNVEDAAVSCTGNLEIAGGAVGSGNALVTCGGSMKVRHVERFIVKVGGDLCITEDAIHSDIVAQGRVQARSIVGGTTSAGEGIQAEVAGAAAETRTVLDAGGTFAIMQEKTELEKQIGSLTIELTGVRDAQYNLVKDAMDEKGVMSAADEGVLDELWTRRAELEQKRTGLREK